MNQNERKRTKFRLNFFKSSDDRRANFGTRKKKPNFTFKSTRFDNIIYNNGNGAAIDNAVRVIEDTTTARSRATAAAHGHRAK